MSLISQQSEQNEKLQSQLTAAQTENASLKIQLGAWHSLFETSQLTHAIAAKETLLAENARLTKERDEIILPAQTTGDGTSRGPLSVFARGWNGYHHELIKLNPNLEKARSSCLDTSGPYRGDLSLRESYERACDQLTASESETARLRALLAEAQKDGARLDWLTENRGVLMETDVERWWAATPRKIFEVCDSPREAIDAAMSATPQLPAVE